MGSREMSAWECLMWHLWDCDVAFWERLMLHFGYLNMLLDIVVQSWMSVGQSRDVGMGMFDVAFVGL